jgi:hypothetical protein
VPIGFAFTLALENGTPAEPASVSTTIPTGSRARS